VQLLVSLAMALLMWLALDPTLVDQLSPGGFVAYITAASLLARPAKMLADVQSIIQRGLAAADEIFHMLDQPSEPDGGTLSIERARGDIDYRDVSFGYHGGELPVLKQISFSIPAGKMVALVGRSGSGKSTIVSLLPRFYDHQSGQITLDGIEIGQLRLASLRAQIAYVSQQITLFNDSVRNNIAYGATAGRSEVQIREAARRAHALEFIEKLPDGFDTLVGDDGVMLSGGQRQRIAIARAFLKDAPILILDEATSALDTESEQKIQAALEEVMKNRTTLVIAHRLSTIIHADQILVIEGGELLESGSHAELLARNGAYTALYERQFADEAAPVVTP
jgi:subfamily B ATP-binding cassette protein MsbA